MTQTTQPSSAQAQARSHLHTLLPPHARSGRLYALWTLCAVIGTALLLGGIFSGGERFAIDAGAVSAPLYFVLCFALAAGALLVGPTLDAHVNRRSGRPPSRLRFFLLGAGLPALATTATLPILNPGLTQTPSLLQRGALILAGAGSLYLAWSLLRRTLDGITLTTQHSAQDIERIERTRLRHRDAKRIYTTARALIDDPSLPRVEDLELRSPGDRDMHLCARVGDVQLQIWRGFVQIEALQGHFRPHDVDTLQAEGVHVAQVRGATLRLTSRAPRGLGEIAARALETWEREDARAAEDRPLQGDAPPEDLLRHADRFPTRAADGALGAWHLDGHTLSVTTTPDTDDTTFDLSEPFRLLLAISPEGTRPRLLVTLRQRADDGPQGTPGDWREAHIAVPMRWRMSALDVLAQQSSSAPLLLHPDRFDDLWATLYWAHLSAGGHPTSLPEIPLDARARLDDETTSHHPDALNPPAFPLSLARFAQLALSAAALTSAYLLTADHLEHFPLLETSFTDQLLTAAALAAGGLLLLVDLGRVDRVRRTDAYVEAAAAETWSLLRTLGAPTEEATVERPRLQSTLRAFQREGRAHDVLFDAGHTFSARLTLWPAGVNASGFTVAEQLELRARPPQDEDEPELRHILAEIHRHLEGFDVTGTLREDGSERVLTLQTRRTIGSGRSAWSALGVLLEPVLQSTSEAEYAGGLLSSTSHLLEPPTTPLPEEDFARVLARPPSGLKLAAATLALSTFAFALPRLQSDAFPTRDQPSGELARACPEFQGDLQSALLERTCLQRAAGDVAEPDLALQYFGANHPRVRSLTFSPLRCEALAQTLEAITRPDALAYGVELARRFHRERNASTRTPVWSHAHTQGYVLEDLEQAVTRCLDHIPAETTHRLADFVDTVALPHTRRRRSTYRNAHDVHPSALDERDRLERAHRPISPTDLRLVPEGYRRVEGHAYLAWTPSFRVAKRAETLTRGEDGATLLSTPRDAELGHPTRLPYIDAEDLSETLTAICESRTRALLSSTQWQRLVEGPRLAVLAPGPNFSGPYHVPDLATPHVTAGPEGLELCRLEEGCEALTSDLPGLTAFRCTEPAP